MCGKNYKGQSKVFLVSADSLIVSCLKWTVICISVAIGYYISRRDIGNELLQKCKKVVREKTAYYRQARKSLWQRVLYCRRQYCLKFGLLRIQQNILSESCIQNLIEL